MSNFSESPYTNKVECPHCGSLAKTYKYSLHNLVYSPARYDENGHLIMGGVNPITDWYKCDNCGREYSSDK